MLEELKETFEKAVDDFMVNEPELFYVDVNERTISSKLACYLAKYFPDWDVDCEYNRLGSEGKRKLIDFSKKNFWKQRQRV